MNIPLTFDGSFPVNAWCKGT